MTQQPPSPPNGPGSYPGPAPPPFGGQPPQRRPNFFSALFDFSFDHFVTPSIIKVLYILGLVAIVVVYLVLLIAGFTASTAFGVLVLVVGPVVGLIYLAIWRVTLEFYYALIRLSEDVHHRGSGTSL